MDTYGDAGGYGDAAELYGGDGGGGGSPGDTSQDENRMDGNAIRRSPN